MSLKTLYEINWDEFLNYTQNIELRLDFINPTQIDFPFLLKKFKHIIVKIIDLKQIIDINSYNKEDNFSKKIIYDIDYIIFINNHHIILKLLNKNIKIISFHNIKYQDLRIYLDIIQNYIKNDYKIIIKMVFKSDDLKKSNLKIKLKEIYNSLKNIGLNNLICFFEGDEFKFTRYQSLILGAPFLYCAINENEKTGVGQSTLNEAVHMLKLLGSFCKNNNTQDEKN